MNLRGIFGTIHQGQLSFDVRTPSELIHALCVTLPKFKEVLKCSNFLFMADKKNIHFNEMQFNLKMGIVDIVPSTCGAKSIFGAFEIILGAALIGAALFFAPELAPWVANIGIGLGSSLVAGGLVAMIFPTPKVPTGGSGVDPNASTLFNGPQNVAQYGIPVPVGFGRCRVGSVLVGEQLKVGGTIVIGN